MRLEAEIHPHPSFTHLAYVLTGLEALARAGRLGLSAVPGDPTSHPLVLRCRLEEGGRERRVVFDMLDRSTEWDLPGLERADVYFKRSFHRPDVERLGPEQARKVEPFGMNFLCRSGWSTLWLLRHAVLPEVRGLARGRRPRWADRRVEYRSFFGSPFLAAFEVPPEVPAARRVALQTRVWTRGELGPESERLNEERVATVRLLRRELGRRFSGGLVPTPLARERWPDALSDAPTARRAYIRWVQGALVGVYTRGLHHSTAFKLPEYLAASRCIVSEPIRNALPRPLVPGEQLLEFRSAEECVARCTAVLERRELQERLRAGAWEYWRSEGPPVARVERCLARALDGPDHALRRAGPR